MSETDPFIIHFNARIHAMKSRLFTKSELDEMLAQDDLSRMSDALLESEYRTDLAEALTRHKGADAIEEAVFRNLVTTFQKLVQCAKGDFENYVRIFLTRWDLAAVKSLLRCRHHAIESKTALDTLIPGPTLTVPLLRNLAKRDSMEGLVAGLVAWNKDLCRGLTTPLETYHDVGDLAPFEETLDRTYFVGSIQDLDEAQGGVPDILKLQLQSEIDRINLRMLFQNLAADEDTANKGQLQKRMLPSGTLKKTILRNMAASTDIAGALEQLSTTRYRSIAAEMSELMQSNLFSPVERLFERLMMTHIRRQSRLDVFGFGLTMDYASLKYNEAVNLRLIARGLAGHLPLQRVKNEMYFAA